PVCKERGDKLRGCVGLEINFSNSFALNKISFLPLHPLLEQGNRKAKKMGSCNGSNLKVRKGFIPGFWQRLLEDRNRF
ncbi:hypothetical protein, partial [Roseivirga thermotolerans]|uniref:hypothetical protein n=1 Tax=Roseivirga thermotolerans TaxID=1758176 RepID=UPI001E55C8B7